MGKIRVVMLGPYLYEMGGVTAHIHKLTSHLSQRNDIELHLITIGSKKETTKKGNLNIHIVRKRLPFPFSTPFLIRKLKRSIGEINPDIVHAQMTNVPYSTVAALIRNKHPALVTVHGIVAIEHGFSHGFAFVSGLVYRLNERYVLSRILNIVAVSPAVEATITSMTGAKIYVIPNGIDLEDIQNIKPHESVKKPSLLFVGPLGKVKGVETLIKAIPPVKEAIREIHLYIAGAGPQKNRLKKLVQELSIGENVEFLGFVQGDKKYSYYKSVDIFVLPSLWDSAPVVLLEAMACGKPVVASNVGGIPSVVENGETGLLFRPGNVEELAEKLIILLQDRQLREKMGKAGAERAKEFTWEKVTEKTVEVYKEVISDFPGTRDQRVEVKYDEDISNNFYEK